MHQEWNNEKFIPDNGLLYRNVHFSQISLKKMAPSTASLEDFDLSCDWNKFSTPNSSLQLLSKQYKNENLKIFKDINDYFIYHLKVGRVRIDFPELEIKHDIIYNNPEKIGEPNNRAHSLVKGDKNNKVFQGKEKLKIATLLSRQTFWEIFDVEKCKQLQRK